ncbi:MAG: hypothetical protein HN566_02450 [Polaribacter sp.]|jgi:hypothetical protein|nr:hypothetical protein [Polaribacter sp.]
MKKFLIKKLIDFTSWEKVTKLDDFSYPWQSEKSPVTSFSAYYDENHIYFRFVAYGSKPLVYIEDNSKLEVMHSERVEIFFRRDQKMSPYYCLEMDPHGRVLDYRANLYRKFDRDWQWPESLSIESKINEENYTVEGKISLSILNELGLINNNNIQIGLFRGHCTNLVGKVALLKWISWVDSKTQDADFHVPSAFGILKLC